MKKPAQPEGRKKQQVMRFTDAELSLIKNTFAENDELLKAMRKVFLQMPLDVIDKDLLSVFKSKELLAVVRKAWLPELDPEAPFHQLIDLLMTVDIKEKTPDEAYPHIVARKGVINYLEQQFRVLETLDADLQKIAFADLAHVPESTRGTLERDAFLVYINFAARNTIISHTEQQIDQLRHLAGLKEETVEETQKRLRQDSSK